MSNTKKKERKSLVTSLDKAEKLMSILYDSEEGVLKGVLKVIKRINKPILIEIFNDYPELIDKYGFRDLHRNMVVYKGATREEFELGNFLSLLNTLGLCSFSQFEKGTLIRDGIRKIEINEEGDIEMKIIKEILEIITLDDFIKRLSDIIHSVIDYKDYSVIKSVFADKNIKSSQKDLFIDETLNMKESKEIIIWFDMTCHLLDVVYFIVKSNSKKKVLRFF